MPLTVALNSMVHLETKGISSDVSRQLKQDVMEGKGLSEAMGRQPVIFSSLYVNMVKAGEQSGALVDVLRRMGDHFERFAKVQGKFKSAMIYPVFVLCVGIAIAIFFMTVMLPSFMQLFQGMHVQLPLATRMLVGMNGFFQHWWWAMASFIVVAAIVFNRFRATESGKLKIDQWRLNAPVFGKVMRLHLFRSVFPHAVDAAAKRRARAAIAGNYRANHSQQHHQGGHRQNPPGSDRRQNHRPTAGPQQSLSRN